MTVPAAILSLLTGVAGWYYLFHSTAAGGLVGLEDQRANARRVRLRRVGGGVMVALAACLYVGFAAAVDDPVNPRVFVAAWSAVMILLGLLVVLALIDVRLTYRLRAGRRRRHRGNELDRDGSS